MSDNLLAGGRMPTLGNALTGGAGATRAASSTTAAPQPFDMQQHFATALRGMPQDEMVRRRDVADRELETIAELVQEPGLNRKMVEREFARLVGAGDMSPEEAVAIAKTMPADSADLKQWAQMLFATVAHFTIHAHAAYPKQLYPGQQATPAAQPEAPEGEAPTAPDESEQPPQQQQEAP